MKKYYPILLAKEGELVALKNLNQKVKDEIVPVLEVLSEHIINEDGNYSEKLENILIENWDFEGNQIFIDFTFFYDIPSSILIIRKLFTNLFKNGINPVPVVNLGSHPLYIKLVSSLINSHGCNLCIRGNNDSGFINFDANARKLVASLNTSDSNTFILIDLGFTENSNHNLLSTVAYQTILSLNSPKNWLGIIVASGSFLSDLGNLSAPSTNKSPAVLHKLRRFEWDIWNTLISQSLPVDIKYSDFGTKHPYYLPATYEGSASIKYTIATDYIIYRGKKASEHFRGGGQYNESARTLISTPEYSGRNFCWGDDQIYLIGNRNDKPGNAGTWVKISQNHHITLIHSLL